MNVEELLSKLEKTVVDGDAEAAEAVAKEAVETGLDPLEAVEKGLAKGLKIVGERFGTGEIFLTDLMAAAEAVKTGLKILKPHILQQKKKMKTSGKVLIGTVAGDIHDIGKSIVATILFANGFEVYDLGVDVSTEVFVKKVTELQPDILGLSALMSNTRVFQKDVIDALRKAGLRNKIKVMIGGAATNQGWAKEIGADDWAADAMEAVTKAKKLMGF
jgi:corrinoid protein of di/trimethylamine methyltransferase